jgi:CheY-like chemotaxis protein
MVDDDEDDKEIFSDTLLSIDPSITCVTPLDGKQALQMLMVDSEQLPNVIFVDLNMPVMNGFEFLKAVKSLRSIRHIPVIIYSTSSDPRHKAQAFTLGASSFITKPSSMRVLKLELTSVIDGLNANAGA